MRILFLNQTFYPDTPATSLYLSPLASELAKRGHEVTVLTSRRAYDDPTRLYSARETWQGVEIVRTWGSGFGYQSKGGQAADFLTFLVTASWRALFLRRFDLVVAQTSPPLISVLGALLALLWRARFLYWIMDLNPDEAILLGVLPPKGLLTSFLEAASRWSMRRAVRIIVQDRFVRDRVAAKHVPEEKIEVIPLWAHPQAAFDSSKRKSFRHEHGLEDKYVVMYAGNHTPCHPLDTLVEAARLLSADASIRFCFIGFGIEWSRLRDRAVQERWPNVRFLGHQALSTGLLSAADTQVVVMGDPFVGIVHACKIYNILAAERPFVYIGPKPSHVTDIIDVGGLKGLGAWFRHGESQALADEIAARARGKAMPLWPDPQRLERWAEGPVRAQMVSVLEASGGSA